MIRISKKDSKIRAKKTAKDIKPKFDILFLFIVLVFIFALSQSIILLMLSLTVKQDSIVYKEKGKVDYKVYLNRNDFYETDYLEQNMVYVSSLINNVATSFNYDFSVDTNSNIDYSYEIVGEIIIYDSLKENVFFRKEYSLTERVEQKIENAKKFAINKVVNIDYGYYNALANNFRKSYGVNSRSDFVVKLKLKYNNNDDMKISESRDMSLTIPLTENEVTIATDTSTIKNEPKFVLGKRHIVIDSSRKLVASVLMSLLSVSLLIYILMSLFGIIVSKNKYDLFIKKILKEYDRLIVNTTTAPTLVKTKVIDVNSFQELLDVRDNLSIPIMYYVEEEHKKCIFYLNHDNEIFILKVDAKDLENKKTSSRK
ncbi:MAG: hypothetical protein IKF82_07710 [Bacilli bacterium]|nr:hypothetical protein [Bacilli bacterium]